ncbi:glycosyltransferase family 4 protein [Pimelobacter simplex]|uniref:Glycosyl transferase, group 1 n=2 Tax=Nocardioides simplex TaxID=2045 RepID=A0A0A1DKF9_NOCSI|nr:glycosyltransferase family 4 protein [Pimelobacter simplex]AIY17028.1 Glycosyl transferase, group 1 [Pimelobacter simplex]GEB12968.1 glycosyl transferase [Pimelobacter simplex]SFM51500.1 Glycosyltransferase involved in cell wall bisynthesis [Pimelobacter simplex]
MRVVQLITQERGGPVDHAVDVAAELARRGHESHLVGPPGAVLDRASGLGVRVHPAAMGGKRDLRGARAIARTLRTIAPDVVHLQDRRAGLVGRLLAGRAAVPTVYTLHGVPDSLAPLVPGNLAVTAPRRGDRAAYLWAERVLASRPRTAVATPCAALARYAREQVGAPAERVHVVPNGVAGSWLDAAPAPRTVPASGRVRAVWVGLLQPVKRVDDLVRATARVPDLELVLVGDGPERARVEAAVAATGTGDRVRLAGYLPDPAPVLRDADLFVLSSAAEASPMALLQAMACGVPPVATSVGGVPEVVRDGVDGLLVRPGDDEQWVAALGALVADAPRRRALGTAARARVAGHHRIDHTVAALVPIYEGVAG